MIALFEGVEKEGKEPFFEEPLIESTGGLEWPNSITEDDP